MKKKAIDKLRLELNKDIDTAIEFASSCGIMEFLFFIFQLHIIRIINYFPSNENHNKEILNVYANASDESIKYIISLIGKFGNQQYELSDRTGIPEMNLKLVQNFLQLGNLINSKYETEALINLFDVQVSGKRNQKLRIDMSSADSNPEVKKLFNYFLRVDNDNAKKKNGKMTKSLLIEMMIKEFQPVKNLFNIEFGISIDEFSYFVNSILNIITTEITNNTKHFTKFENGRIDVQSQKTFLFFSKAFLINKQEHEGMLNGKFKSIVDRLTFKSEEFHERQLRYHYATRKPFFEFDDYFIISPQLLLDSLATNIHYSLLESTEVRANYKGIMSTEFLNEIVEIANKYGYVESDREIDLLQGKKQLGDIDLILKNTDGHYLLIEGKNHMLPLDIYFKDVEKTKAHLQYLQDKWEEKVVTRINHLQSNQNHYYFSENYSYIIISKFPEILSHYSNLLVLSINEFEDWISSSLGNYNFNDFYRITYENKSSNLTKEELDEMGRNNIYFGEFKKE